MSPHHPRAQQNGGRAARILLAASAALFLSYQLYLSAGVWERQGNVPPAFDDSYFYVFSSRKVLDHQAMLPDTAYPPRHAHLMYLSYAYSMASLCSIVGLAPETGYRASFFIGKFVLLLCLIRFLTSVEPDRLVVASVLTALAAFSGSPEFHGFFWVVPSFWLLCIFFYWVAAFGDRPDGQGAALVATGFLGATMHPLGPYLAVPLGIYVLLLIGLQRFGAPAPAARAFFLIGTGVLLGVALPQALPYLPAYQGSLDVPNVYVQLGGGWPDPAGPPGSRSALSVMLPGLAGVWRSYFKFFQTLPALAALAGSLALLVNFRRWNLVALYAAAAALTLASTVHPLASRTCLLLWPVTLMVLGSAPVLAWRLLRPYCRGVRAQVAVGATLAASLGALVLFWHVYNAEVLRDVRRFSQWRWEPRCALELLERTTAASGPVFYGSKYAASAFLAHGLERRSALPLSDLDAHARRLAPGHTIWAVIDNPAVPAVSQAAEEMAMLDQLRRSKGLAAEREDCGLFLVFELQRR